MSSRSPRRGGTSSSSNQSSVSVWSHDFRYRASSSNAPRLRQSLNHTSAATSSGPSSLPPLRTLADRVSDGTPIRGGIHHHAASWTEMRIAQPLFRRERTRMAHPSPSRNANPSRWSKPRNDVQVHRSQRIRSALPVPKARTTGWATTAPQRRGEENSRFTKVFRTDWEEGRAFYHPYDRRAADSHPDWRTQQPHLVWTSDRTIVDYLEEFHSLLNSDVYVASEPVVEKSPCPSGCGRVCLPT